MEVRDQCHAYVPLGKDSGAHWMEGWQDPRSDLNAVAKRK